MLIFLTAADAQITKRPRFDTGVNLTEAVAAQRWSEFVSNSLAGDFCMAFRISHRPRRGEDVKYAGLFMGSQRGDCIYTRIEVAPLAAPEKTECFIFKNSPRGSSVWKLENGAFRELSRAEWFAPLCGGLLYAPFDLMMPYKFWSAKYAGSGRAGQPVNFFELSSADFPNRMVEVALSKDFNAPVRARIFEGGRAQKTARLGSVKKVGDVWIMREASVKDELSKDADALVFTAAKFKISLPQEVFSPDSNARVKPPQMEKF